MTDPLEPNSWRSKIMALVKKHDLGFLHNPGGGQFTNAAKGINIQVPLCDYQEDYVVLLKGLRDLGIDPLEPNDLSHLSDEECLALCPQGFHATGDFEPDFRALCAELADSVELLLEMRDSARPMQVTEDRLKRARAALAAPLPELPTDREIYEWAAPRRFAGEALALTICAALERWGQCYVQPPKPLTDDEINDLWNRCGTADEYGHHEGNIFEFARAIQERGQ